MPNYGFIIDNRRCIGCHACTVACKSEHEVPIGVNRTWVKYIEKGEFPNSRRLFSVMRCNHCDNAPCVQICPVTALYRRDDGIVDFDNRRCIGCKACMQACPYDALYIDPETNTAAKCNYCAHRVEVGLEPACVNVCPTQAIISGDLDDPNSRIAKLKSREQVTTRKSEKGTLPALFYIEGDAASLEPAETEAIEQSMWGQQVGGVGHWSLDHREHALDRLGRLLNLGDSTSMLAAQDSTISTRATNGAAGKAGPEQNTTAKQNLAQNLVSSLTPKARRAYDAPQKGVLWGWQVSGYLWTKSISAGACLLPLLAKTTGWATIGGTLEIVSLFVSLIFLAITGGLLMWDLDQPKRFLYVLLRPQWGSWLVRGAYIITVFAGLLSAYTVLRLLGHEGPIEFAIRLALIPLSILTALYTAFLFAQAKGRDFWQSPILSVHMVVHAVLAGAAAMALGIFGPAESDTWSQFLLFTMIVAIGFNLCSMAFELGTTHPTRDASRTVKLITRGRYKNWFWGGVVVLGNLVPLALMLMGGGMLLPLVGIVVLIGVFISQHIWVRAPQQIPLA